MIFDGGGDSDSISDGNGDGDGGSDGDSRSYAECPLGLVLAISDMSDSDSWEPMGGDGGVGNPTSISPLPNVIQRRTIQSRDVMELHTEEWQCGIDETNARKPLVNI